MDRNDSNPGMVERQLDDSPMEGASSSDRELSRDGMGEMDRDSSGGMQGSPSQRDGGMSGSSSGGDSLQGSGSASEPMTGRESERLGVANTNANDAEMSLSSREGGYGYDRPADLTVNSDMEATSRDTDQGTDRVRHLDSGAEPGRESDRSTGNSGSSNTTARDW